MADPLPWLLEPDNPSARYLALTRLLDQAPDSPAAMAARSAIPNSDPARSILDAQFAGLDAAGGPSGYWIKPDLGYSPKYRATVWQIIFLAQLGAPAVEPIRRACDYVLDHCRYLADRHGRRDGRFTASKGRQGAINCLNGNLLWALQRLGLGDDPRLAEAREATAGAIDRHGFGCRYNDDLACAWGAVKVLRAFLEAAADQRTPIVEGVIDQATTLLLSVPLLEAVYPATRAVSPRWFQLCFPLGFNCDILEAMGALMLAGQADHPHMQDAVEWLVSKQGADGKWALERVPGKMWTSFGTVGQPDKWVTIRALEAVKALSRHADLR
jgi:hypothetical protein